MSSTKTTLNKTCSAPDCAKKAVSRGHCPRHYQQMRRYGRLTPEREYKVAAKSTCSAPSC